MSTTGSLLSEGAIGTLDKLARRGFASPPYKRQQIEKQVASGRHLTLLECSEELGLTRERVRQIEVSALKKCRIYCDSHGYRLRDLIR